MLVLCLHLYLSVIPCSTIGQNCNSSEISDIVTLTEWQNRTEHKFIVTLSMHSSRSWHPFFYTIMLFTGDSLQSIFGGFHGLELVQPMAIRYGPV